MLDVRQWLRALGLERYADTFLANHVDGEVLASLGAEDLRELGVASLGHRKRLLAAIAELSVISARPEPPEAAAARRPVTVLFVDLSGFTALSRALDAEAVHGILQAFFAVADAAIERHGGRVDKHIGDCVMGVFGAPRAHGDDPERAVAAALAIRAAMPDLARRLGRALGIHAGLGSGQVVASATGSDAKAEYTVTGDSVNLAARLMAAAAEGDILIDAALRRAVGDAFACAPVGPLDLAGFETPQQAWRVLDRGRSRRAVRGPLIGRGTELSQVRAMLGACQAQGAGVTLHLRGEPGIGKSRLVAAGVDLAAEAGFRCHEGQVLDFGVDGPAGPFGSLVAGLLDPVAVGAEGAGRALAQARAAGDIDAEQAGFLRGLLGEAEDAAHRARRESMPAGGRRQAQAAAVTALLARACRVAPRLLVVEDVHWADAETLAILAQVAAAIARLPAMLIVTGRTDSDPLGPAWRASAAGAAMVTVDLGPLPATEAHVLAAGRSDLPVRVVENCVARADGNPLFLEQLLLHARDQASAAVEVPVSIQGIVLARVDRLPARDRAALQAASILGQIFDLAALCDLAGDPGYDPATLIERQLVRPSGEGLRFAHALIRDGVYGSMLSGRREALHRSAAAWYATRDPSLHALHLDRAGDGQAAAAYLVAARAQMDRLQPTAARPLLDRGLALAAPGPDQRGLRQLLAEACLDLGDAAAARTLWAIVLEQANGPVERCRALIGLASALRILDAIDEAFACLAEAEAAASGLPELLAEILHLRGNLHFPRGEVEACRAAHAGALGAAEASGSVVWMARALGGLGDADYGLGRLRSAAASFGRCAELAAAHGLLRVEAANRPMLAIIRALDGPLPVARAEAEAAVECAAAIGFHRGEMVAHHGAFMAAARALRLEDAAVHADRAQALAKQIGARRFEAENLAFMAEVAYRAGRRGEADELLREAWSVACETGVAFVGPIVLGLTAEVAGDPARRAWAIAEGTRLMAGRRVLAHNAVWFHGGAIEAALAGGDAAAAMDAAERLSAAFAAEPVALPDFLARRGRILAAALMGCPDAVAAAALLDRGRALGYAAHLAALEAVAGA